MKTIETPPWDELDNGIREAVRTLWLAGWNPQDSGDGSKAEFMECAVDYPMIACKEEGSDVKMYLERGNMILERMKLLGIVNPGMTVEISYGASGCLVIFADYSKFHKECSVEPEPQQMTAPTQMEFEFVYECENCEGSGILNPSDPIGDCFTAECDVCDGTGEKQGMSG